MSYSQKNEEDVVARAVGDYIGGCVEIGAYNGRDFSNTMALIERGWQAILVEPGLHAFMDLLDNHGNNDRVTLVHAALGPNGGMTQFWNNPRTFSTTCDDNRFNRFPHEGFSAKYWVPFVDWCEVITCRPGMPVDVVSIDTEGTSVELFKAFPFSMFRPKVMVVEHDGRVDECIAFAKDRGYRLIMGNEENLVVTHG